MKEYDARAKPGPKNNIKHDGQQMVSTMYEIGFNEGMDGEDVKVKMKNGKVKTFNLEKETCPWDESHEADDLPEDVTEIKGFGVASLLLVMQRRFVESLQIYTYVGDVVLCLNPYMYLPAMVDIARDPVKQYRLGKEPHSYASAHFAYWGVVDPDNFGTSPCLFFIHIYIFSKTPNTTLTTQAPRAAHEINPVSYLVSPVPVRPSRVRSL